LVGPAQPVGLRRRTGTGRHGTGLRRKGRKKPARRASC
jgi:hypothetical protein